MNQPDSSSWNRLEKKSLHVCHCIGCCTKCGQCRTSPDHARTCDRIADLNEARRQIIEEDRA